MHISQFIPTAGTIDLTLQLWPRPAGALQKIAPDDAIFARLLLREARKGTAKSMEIGEWLEDLGLRQYEEAFRANGVDAAVLPKLTSDDLKEIGVVAVGHRRKLLEAIAELRENVLLPDERPNISERFAASNSFPLKVLEAERRQLTVMFCDLVGSTVLSTRLDPEELHDLLATYRACVTNMVRQHHGYVAKHLGDGVLVYFGYPDAHEDDAERAVRAALALVEAVRALEFFGERLQVRIGVATGLVVVGDLVGSGEAQERGVVGETPNLAARLQSIAEPGGVIIATETRRLVGGLFDCRSCGPVKARGFIEPVEAFEVLHETEATSRFDALRPVRTALIGRDDEMALLRQRWKQACGGDGRVVLVTGEPGIGKSRLVSALLEEPALEFRQQARCFCSPHTVASPLSPVIRYLESHAGFGRDDDDKSRSRKLEAMLAQYAISEPDRAFLSALLSLPPDQGTFLDGLTPQRLKERTLGAITRLFEGLTTRGPALILWEDAHWIDATSLELLAFLVPRIKTLPVLLVITFRPEFVAPWTGEAGVTLLTLSRLERRQNVALAKEVAGGRSLPVEIMQEIIARTDGVPLFIEELTRSLLESELLCESDGGYVLGAPLLPRAVPDSLHASLLARLDRLGSARHVAQVGAAVGREFSHELLAVITGQSKSELREALDQLIGAELLFVRGQPPDAIYLFKHALVQEAAYDTLLKSRRRELHGRIAQALEVIQPEIAERQPELLASHCARGGLPEKAVELWLKAGQRATRSSANREAISHLTQALEMLRSLPETIERERREIEILFALGPALFATRGWTDSVATETYERARELCEKLGEERQRFDALWGLRYAYTAHGETEEGLDLLNEMLSTAERLDDQECRLQAHHAAWVSLSWLGDPVKAHEHVEQGIRIYDKEKHAAQALRYGGHDPGVCARGHGSLPLWLLGYPDQAAGRAEDGLALAEGLAHGPSLAHGLLWAATCHQLRGDASAVLANSDRLLAIAKEHGLALYEASALALRGWGLAEQGRPEEGVTVLRRGLAAYTATDVKAMYSYHLASLAQIQLRLDAPEQALATVEEAHHLAEEAGEGFWRAEILRLQGEACWKLGGIDKAASHLLDALELARLQSARSLELRIAASLVRLPSDSADGSDRLRVLSSVLEGFTEGHETRDQKEAKALLSAPR